VLLTMSKRLAGSLLHVVRGIVICLVVFPIIDAQARRHHIARWTSKMLTVLGVQLIVHGSAAPGRVLICANHVSWLDILAIQAILPVRFVSKSEVQRWPLVGMLAAAAETLFVERAHRRDAVRVVHDIASALSDGQIVTVFPEGTTGSGPAVLPFHGNLLQAAIIAKASIQPIALRFSDRRERFSSAATFLGQTTLLRSVLRIAEADGLTVHVTLLPAIAAAGRDRKSLAVAARDQIQGLLTAVSRATTNDCR
jgi:1-acyl-sn-glycerol-3-phosphate acyltransferase